MAVTYMALRDIHGPWRQQDWRLVTAAPGAHTCGPGAAQWAGGGRRLQVQRRVGTRTGAAAAAAAPGPAAGAGTAGAGALTALAAASPGCAAHASLLHGLRAPKAAAAAAAVAAAGAGAAACPCMCAAPPLLRPGC